MIRLTLFLLWLLIMGLYIALRTGIVMIIVSIALTVRVYVWLAALVMRSRRPS